MSIRRMNESFDKKFKEEYAPVEEVKEGYELLDGTKVELYKDYYKAVERAKELGLKEAEYGDAYGVSYCMWNTSGDRNEDEEVIAYYKFEGRKPRPLTDDEAERIARDIGVQFEDFDESLKEANEPDLTPKERREFISKMTKALMGDKFGYSHAEANDIAIKRADALGDDWRARWGGDINKEIKQELERTVSKVGYQSIYGKMADESLKEGHTWGDTTIEDYVEKNFSGDDESKQKLIDWFVSLDYTNQFGFKDISVKDIFKKANEFGLSRKYSAIESINESQSQEIAYYYRQLKDKNGFDVARLADAFYKTPEWKEIGFQGDVLFTEKGWNAFKKWAKETKNVDIKDLGSSDDFLGEGRLTEKQWRYTLENGRALRDAIETEDYTAILATIQLCYQELNEVGLIDDDDCDRWVQDIDDIDIEDATYDDIDWELDQFYDLCDNIGVWIPLNEDTVKQGSQWVNKGKEGTHGKFKTKKEADAQRKAMYANGYKESKKIPTKKGIDEDFSVKIDWAFLEWEIDAELGSAKVVLTEQNAGYAKFDITFADGFNIKGNLVGNPRQITVSVPALKAKKTCRDSYEIAQVIQSLHDNATGGVNGSVESDEAEVR